NDSIVVFSAKGVEQYSTPSKEQILPGIAPWTTSIAISNRDSSGAVWAAFESPFLDGPRVPIVGRLTLGSGRVTWTPSAVPGLSQLGEIKSIYVDDRGIVWLGGTDGLLRLVPGELQAVGMPRAPLIRASVGFGEK